MAGEWSPKSLTPPRTSRQAAQVKPLPVEEGLYYRTHHKDAPFGREHASTQNIGEPPSPDMAKYWEPKPGYSAFWSPHHLHQYHTEMGWDTTEEMKGRRVLAFRGTPVGEGADGEPRVMPHSDKPEASMSWGHFRKRLEVTPEEPTRWDDHTWGQGPHGQMVDDGYRTIGGHTASQWSPQVGIFGPTTGLDPRLFDGAADESYVLYHGAHHDDVPGILTSGLRGDPGQPTVTTSREGAELYGQKRDWTAPKVLEIHVPRSQAHRYLGEAQEGLPVEGTVHALRETLPPAFIRAVHEASQRRTAVHAAEPGSDHGLPEDASRLGIVYHSTPYKAGFPYDDWMHVGTRAAAEDRAHAIRPEDFGLPGDTPVYMHSMKLRGRVYPKVISDETANEICGSGHAEEVDEGYPSGRGYHVFPYKNSTEGRAQLSFLVHKSAIVHQRQEEYPRPESNPAYHAAPAYHQQHLHVVQASAWQPTSGIFGPTTGLDPLLFNEGGELRGQVRHDLMTRLDQCLRVDSGLAGSDWQEWLHVYLAGGSASEWAGSRPNDAAQDLDVIVAIDLAEAQGCNAFEGMNGGEAASALNAAFWKHFNADGWQPESGGTWNLTAFCNQRAQGGIEAIKPYAAYDVTDGRWAVKPPHLPEHTVADFSPAVTQMARAVAAEARAILRMDEPLRTREARALWERVHAGRSVAFSDQGTGWQDAGNLVEKWLAYAPHGLLGKIRDLAMAKTAERQNPLCRYCGEPIDDEDAEEGHDSHAECQQMAWCEPHQDYHDDPVEAEGHNDTYTDWSMHLPFEGGIHRGINKEFDPEVHQVIHDESRPVAERAAFLRNHLNENPSEGMGLQRRLTDEEKYGQTGHFGVHWTDSEPHARGWAEDDYYEGPRGGGPKPSVTHVVLHAASPDWEHVEEEPEELERRHMYGFDHDRSEREVPLKVGAPVRLTGISWKRGGEGEWSRHDFGQVAPKTAAWHHDTSGSDHSGVYLRFGDWPHDERSFSPASGYHEEGVSAYDLDRDGDPSIGHGLDRGHEHGEYCDEDCQMHLDDPGNDPQEEMQGRVRKAERNRDYGNDKPSETGHLVRGEMSGVGYDGEPLLKNVKRVGDWIDHRHLFLDQAGPHRLARSPHDEDYEEPEEKPPYGDRNRTAALESQEYWLDHRPPGPGHTDQSGRPQPSVPYHEATGRDPEDLVDVYRGAPEGTDEINQGDWVTLHGDWARDRGPNVLHARVPARHVYLDAKERDDDEAGYHGPAVTAMPKTAAAHPWHGWAVDQPHKAVIWHAQSRVRDDHPELTRPLPPPDAEGFSAEGHSLLKRALTAGGYPAGRAERSFVLAHEAPDENGTSQVAMIGNRMGIALHPRSWDLGTVAHEAAHLLDIHRHGRDPVQAARVPDEEMHGPAFAGHYATALNVISPGAGDDFLRHHADSLKLVGNFRARVHGLPREYPGSEPMQREATTSGGVPQRPKRTPGSAMVYLDVPHGTVDPYAGQEGGHHVALAYLPRSIGDEDFERVKDRAREAAARHAPMKATVGGGEVFPPGTPSDRRRVAVVPVHAPGIHELHREFSEFDRAHYETYTPHVTRAQLGGHQADPPPHPEASFPVTHVHVRRGDEVHSFPLTGPSRREAAAEDGHESWYHITDNPHFSLDPHHEPQDNSISIHQRTGQGIYLTKHPEGWVNGHGYVRPYVAEVHARPEVHEHDTNGRWGGEMFVPAEHFDKLHVHRVIPLDAHAREEYGEHGWIEDHHGTDFGTNEDLPERKMGWRGRLPEGHDYRYEGPDVRDMSPAEHARHRDRWLGYMKENRDWDEEGLQDLRESHDSHRKTAAAEKEPETYYHVSYARFPRGHMLTPQGAGQVNFPGQSSGEHVYMTGDRDHAETYRYHLWEQGYPEQHLYEVSPHGPVEPDPHDEQAVRTRHPVEVTWHENADDEDENDWFHHREAAAEGGPWYHGTSVVLRPGDHVQPAMATGWSSPYAPTGEPGEVESHTHATSDPGNAADYAHADAIFRGTGHPHVYKVTPLGDTEEDPGDNQGMRSSAPMRVDAEVPRSTWQSAHSEYLNSVTESRADFARDMQRTAVSGYDGLTGKSGMIYLDLPPGTVRQVPGGVDDHHVTLVYLGKNVSGEAFEEACRRTRAAAAKLAPMDGVLRGIDVFPPSKGSDGKVVAFVPAYVGSVGLLRRELEDLSASEHADWRPHVTLAYLEEGDSLPAPHPAVPLRFTRVHVKRGDDVRSYPLGGGMGERRANREDLGQHLEEMHGWFVHPHHDLEHEHAWDHRQGDVETPHEHAPGEADHPLASTEPPTHSEVLRSMGPGKPRDMPMEEALSLHSGDWGGPVREHLDDIREKIGDEYRDGGEDLRRTMSSGILPGGAVVVNGGRLDDGHRRLWMAHNLGWSSIKVRSGAW